MIWVVVALFAGVGLLTLVAFVSSSCVLCAMGGEENIDRCGRELMENTADFIGRINATLRELGFEDEEDLFPVPDATHLGTTD